MTTSILNSFAKPLSRLVLAASLIAGVAAAAEPQADPQSLAQQLLSPTRSAPSREAGTKAYAALPDAQEQARRLLEHTPGGAKPAGMRAESSPARSPELHRGHPVETQDLARRMILGRDA